MEDCLPRDGACSFIAERERSHMVHDLRAFLAVLRKNRRKLAIDPAWWEPAEALPDEFEGSLRKLLPLLERIKADG